MKSKASASPVFLFLGLLLLGSPSVAQSSTKNSAVAINPVDTSEVWACNRGNDSV